MPIELRGESFQVTVNHKRERYRRSFKDHKEAKIWEAQSKADLIAGKKPDMGRSHSRLGTPQTIEDLAWYTYENEWAGTPSDDKSQINLKQVIDAFGGRTLIRDVDMVMIDNAKLKWKQSGNANSTVNRKLSCLSKMMTKAKDMGIIADKPKIYKEKEPQSRMRWFTDDERKRMYAMLHHLGHSRVVGLVQVLIGTGFRCGELFRLEPRDVQDNLLVVDINKSSWPRSVPMRSHVKAVIEEELSNMTEDQTTIFGWINYEKFLRIWKQMQLHLGWQDDEQAVPHTCRHTFVTDLMRSGMNLVMVQQLAGHKTLAMTQKYAHLAPNDLEQAMAAMDSRPSNIYSLHG